MDARLPSPPSLMGELNNKNYRNDATDSGWRVLGDRKVWKADWTEYDARKSRHLSQEKLTAKASKRRKQKRAYQKMFNKNNNSHNHRRNNNNNNYNRNNNDYNCNTNHANNNHNNKNNNNNSKHNINHNNNNFGNNNNNNISNNYRNNNTNRNSFHSSVSQNRNNLLPPDRELLAAAKDRFSRPPQANYRPTMQFQRGEILNPYPSCDVYPRTVSAHLHNGMAATASCEACVCRNSCFVRN
ncbi:GATA zinc finger domain-containing protein 15-like [Ochlerotatus camptorhynchus]|uniref:GATA zinc finger domain-containing protein 15-like n=1 Tax=Ochlerotatus camptorhynchus TaxID=644619 RepID=UPI0031D92561